LAADAPAWLPGGGAASGSSAGSCDSGLTPSKTERQMALKILCEGPSRLYWDNAIDRLFAVLKSSMVMEPGLGPADSPPTPESPSTPPVADPSVALDRDESRLFFLGFAAGFALNMDARVATSCSSKASTPCTPTYPTSPAHTLLASLCAGSTSQ